MTGAEGGHRRTGRRARALVLAGLLTLLGWAGASPAVAHTGLASASPEDGAELSAAPEDVVLTFTGDVRSDFAQVAVTGPDGTSSGDGEPTVAGAEVRQPIRAGEPGAYVVAYRVLSADGHPVSGTVGFTVQEPAAGTSAAAGTSPTAGTSPASEPGDSPSSPPAVAPVASGRPTGAVPLWLVAVGGLVVAAAALVSWRSWRRAR